MTTVDVLAAYGRQLHAVVPAQIGFSRGADGVVVRSDIKRINELKGKIIATAQFTEVDFFIRYLAQEAGLPINTLGSLDATPHPDRLNVVYTEDGFEAGDLFLNDVKSGKNKLAGCVTWEPKVSEVVERQRRTGPRPDHQPQPADHRRRADRPPRLRRGSSRRSSQGLVQGLLEGNRMVRDKPDAEHRRGRARVQVGRAARPRSELANVHLSNLPENLAFFSGAIDAAGSFGGIYQSAVLAYGSDLIKDPPDPSRFAELSALQAIEKTGHLQGPEVAIAPIRSSGAASVESDPLLSKDIRFLFEPNSANARHRQPGQHQAASRRSSAAAGQPGLDAAAARPRRQRHGRGVPQDRAARPTCARQALRAMELSKNRAGEIRKLLIEKYVAVAGH